MKYQTVAISDNLLASMNMNVDEIVSSMRREYAVNMYRTGKLTLKQSAELCDMNLYDFMALLSLSNVAVIDYSAEELEKELAQFYNKFDAS